MHSCRIIYCCSSNLCLFSLESSGYCVRRTSRNCKINFCSWSATVETVAAADSRAPRTWTGTFLRSPRSWWWPVPWATCWCAWQCAPTAPCRTPQTTSCCRWQPPTSSYRYASCRSAPFPASSVSSSTGSGVQLSGKTIDGNDGDYTPPPAKSGSLWARQNVVTVQQTPTASSYLIDSTTCNVWNKKNATHAYSSAFEQRRT